MFLSKTMLSWTKYVVIIQVLPDGTGDDVLEHFTCYTRQGDWAIITRCRALPLFEDGRYTFADFQSVGTSPDSRDWVNRAFKTGASWDEKFFNIHVDT